MKLRMTPKALAASLLAMMMVYPAFANEGAVPKGVPRLDHVFVIMMENHGYKQIIGNPNAPFANQLANHANVATNYFAIGHPSSTNYLETVGGSNFGVRSDNNPDWHNANCVTNLQSGQPNLDNPNSGNVCPIGGSGTDAETPATDCTNEVQCSPSNSNPELNIDGTLSIPAAANISGKTIADQLTEWGKSWKTYQQSLPPSGADGVNFADGFFTDSSNIPGAIPGEAQSLIKLYAAKHNPFVYFRSVQEGGLDHVVGFQGAKGLFDDLATGYAPNFSFIAPDQCNDQHGRSNAGPKWAQPRTDQHRRPDPQHHCEGHQGLASVGRGPERHRCAVGRGRLQCVSYGQSSAHHRRYQLWRAWREERPLLHALLAAEIA